MTGHLRSDGWLISGTMESMNTTDKIPQTAERFALIFAALVVLFIAFLAYRSAEAFRRSSNQAAVTRQVVNYTNALLSALKDAETGQRGFLLTGEDRYLEPYRQARTQIPPLLDQIARIQAERPQAGLSPRIERLRPLVNDKLDELNQTIELRRSQGFDAALAVVRTDRGKTVMDQIRAVCGEIQQQTYDFSAQAAEQARARGDQSGIIAVVGSSVILVVLVFATIAIERGTRRRQRLIGALRVNEDRLRQSRDWLQTTIASIGDAVITTDASGKITLMNAVAENVTGWKSGDALGKPLDQVFVIRNEDTGREVENPVSKVLREDRIVGLANHTKLIARDGRDVPIDDSAAPIRDADGKITGVVMVFRDISEKRAAEKREADQAAELRLSNERLLRANEDLNQFAFAASHDLQEPLRVITSYSQLLLIRYRDKLDGDAATWAEFITEGTTRMRDLLKGLLAYTKMANEREAAAERVDLNRVLSIVLENCKLAIEEAAATVTSDPLPAVQGQEPHFIQLLQNLISNSLKYRAAGRSPRIHVFAERQNGHWKIAVKDNGMGIAPEYHKQIFGIFKRLHGNTISGTGIGLAICQRVVDRYGGNLWVESREDEAATFYFTLPGIGERSLGA